MRYWLVMPAAGAGRRFGAPLPKQYAPLCGRTVIEWALAPFLSDSRCAGIALALAQDDPYWPQIAGRLTAERMPSAQSPASASPGIIVAPGGRERYQSVRNALAALSGQASPEEWVLVHDAARPCLTEEDRDALLDKVSTHPVGGLLATPAADTLKQARADATVVQTVDRSSLWRALTPQMFRYARLCQALDQAHASGRVPTDEAQALEWLGESPLLVAGSTRNIKVTSAADLLLAEALLGAATKPDA